LGRRSLVMEPPFQYLYARADAARGML
jgi:hypothetical protein